MTDGAGPTNATPDGGSTRRARRHGNVSEMPRSRPMERQDQILQYVMEHGFGSASDFASQFSVSQMTVYRDFDELERQGMVRKFRGGVTAQPSSVFESNVAYRLAASQEEKAALARYARELVEPGMSVMLDDATTTLALARTLDDISPLTIITNFLEIIKVVSDFRDVRLIALGGEFDVAHDSFLGSPCIEMIQTIRADILFASTSALSQGVAFHQEQEIVLVKRAMMAAAQRKILLVDNTKLERFALHRLAPLSDFDLVVVDGNAPASALADLREHQVRFEVAPLS